MHIRESYLAEYVMTVARAIVVDREAYRAYRIAIDEIGALDHFEEDETDRSQFVKHIYSSPLPEDLSAWELKGSEIFVEWMAPYSKNALRQAISEGHAAIYHMFSVCTACTGMHSSYVGDIVSSGTQLTPLQYDLNHLFAKRKVLGKEKEWQVNWKFEAMTFTPFSYDPRRLDCPQTGQYFATDQEDAFRACQRLIPLIEAPPSFVACEYDFSRANGIDLYLAAQAELNRKHKNWMFSVHYAYKIGFDPFVRPKTVPETGVHYPVALKGRGQNGVEFQLDVVHTPECSYIELLTGYGMDNLRRWTELFPGFEWEYWPGAPEERWNGNRTPVPLPPVTPVPPLSFKSELEWNFEFFVHERVLTILIHKQIGQVPSGRFIPNEAGLKREQAGYTPEEIRHLEYIDRVEANFDKICARVPEWDSIRFWWPHRDDDHYWEQRPNLRGVKALPMKVHGEVREIPVEFVEPLKCPM